ncbi:Virulence-associated protein E [Methylobacterium sp. 174MFSha1.1]|uniref:VapE domain-containing protein n=1 Tax=Methylobacterium sp. 174MFSha1.1 TaxID=1502749 RepID=UPI0008E15F74|nr:VapE domain-containing protein [Methylobacterium sp. 174MFSha1.1]SFV11009.1 Virulence-associated protein E [Methylobacterium sp. 174MFSha1.1]
MTLTIDTTAQFETLLRQHAARAFVRNGEPTPLTEVEYADLMAAADTARSATPGQWNRLRALLVKIGGFEKEAEALAAANKAQIHGSLGAYPDSPADLISLWTEANHYAITYSGLWHLHGRLTRRDTDYVAREIKLFASAVKLFNKGDIENAFFNWVENAKERILAEASIRLAFQSTLDPGLTELRKFVDLIIGGSDDPDELEVIRSTAVIAFANFIYRVKNHLRYNFKSSAHLMIVLQGCQGDGKSTAIECLCAPLVQMWTKVSLEAFNNSSMAYQFSEMPIMVFEEMAGASKTDIDGMKAVMTDPFKLLDQKWKIASVRPIVVTFIGASNNDIRKLLKDDTGNRRVIQFNSKSVTREKLFAIDFEKIWRSIDEDAIEPPMYSSPEATALINGTQETQRVIADVENWILEGGSGIVWGSPMKDREAFDAFKMWADNGGVSEANRKFLDKKRFVADMRELKQRGRFDIVESERSRYLHFTIQRPEDDQPTAREVASRDRLKAAVEAKAKLQRTDDDETWREVERETAELIQQDSALARAIRVQRHGRGWGEDA